MDFCGGAPAHSKMVAGLIHRRSVFEEMRMTSLLPRVRLHDGTALTAERALAMGTRTGAEMLDVDAGMIAPGRLEDLVAIDLGDPSRACAS